jgi:hypothetical protein
MKKFYIETVETIRNKYYVMGDDWVDAQENFYTWEGVKEITQGVEENFISEVVEHIKEVAE